MPEPVMFIRGFPRSIFGQSGGSETVVEDLKIIAELSDDEIVGVCHRLKNAEGFLDPKALLALIREVVQVSKSAEAVQRVIKNLTLPRIERILKSIESEKDCPFDQAKFEHLRNILGKLVQPCPALINFQKADRLSKITGQRLESAELICDLRPVFSENRETVEGMLPYTRLHVVATGEDGLPKPFEVELSYEQVLDLEEKVKKTKDKIDVLRKLENEEWTKGGVPDLSLTSIPRKEPSGV